MSESIKLADAAKELRIEPDTLKKRCQRGNIKDAFKGEDGKWHIPLSVYREMKAEAGEPYEFVYKEWILRMKKGIGYKKPCSERSIEAYEYGLKNFWIFVYNPPKVIKTSFKKGEPRPAPKMEPTITWMTAKHIALSLSNVPIDREQEKCHFSMREKMFNAFKSFYRLMIDMGYGTKAEYEKISAIQVTRIYEEKRKVITAEDALKLLKTNETLLSGRLEAKQDFDIALTRLILCLGIFVGLRREEMATIKLSNVDLENSELSLLGKGTKYREVGFSLDVKAAIVDWLRYRPKNIKCPYLLTTIEGEFLKPDLIYKRVKRIGKLAGIDIWTHALRATNASLSLEQGIPLHLISESLGHSRVSTTEKSYIKINRRKAIEAAKNFSLSEKAPIFVPQQKQLSERAIKILEGIQSL